MYVRKSRRQITAKEFLISAVGFGVVLAAFLCVADWFLFRPSITLYTATANGALIALGFIGAALWIVSTRLTNPVNQNANLWRKGVFRTLAISSFIGAALGFILVLPLHQIAFGIASCAIATSIGLLPVRAKRWVDTSDLGSVSFEDLNIIYEDISGDSDRGSRVLREMVADEIERRRSHI